MHLSLMNGNPVIRRLKNFDRRGRFKFRGMGPRYVYYLDGTELFRFVDRDVLNKSPPSRWTNTQAENFSMVIHDPKAQRSDGSPLEGLLYPIDSIQICAWFMICAEQVHQPGIAEIGHWAATLVNAFDCHRCLQPRGSLADASHSPLLPTTTTTTTTPRDDKPHRLRPPPTLTTMAQQLLPQPFTPAPPSRAVAKSHMTLGISHKKRPMKQDWEAKCRS
jgi:hypothetical protein